MLMLESELRKDVGESTYPSGRKTRESDGEVFMLEAEANNDGKGAERRRRERARPRASEITRREEGI